MIIFSGLNLNLTMKRILYFTYLFVVQVVYNLVKHVYATPNQIADIEDMQEVCNSISNSPI